MLLKQVLSAAFHLVSLATCVHWIVTDDFLFCRRYQLGTQRIQGLTRGPLTTSLTLSRNLQFTILVAAHLYVKFDCSMPRSCKDFQRNNAFPLHDYIWPHPSIKFSAPGVMKFVMLAEAFLHINIYSVCLLDAQE